MENNGKYVKAYNNYEFLNSSEARSLRILAEFHEPKSRFRKYNIVDTVVFFGSARLLSSEESNEQLSKFKERDLDKNSDIYKEELKIAENLVEMSKYYDDAAELAKKLTEWSKNLPTKDKRFIVCSGGGPGIMEAANKGAKEANGFSIGMNISIPFEQYVNKYLDPRYTFEFHYFFMRKFWFVYLAKALIVFPGGFGTLDELMEVLTLLQTGKIKKEMKVIVYGEEFWKKIVNFDALADMGVISREDMELFDFCNTVDDAFGKITAHLEEHYLNKEVSL